MFGYHSRQLELALQLCWWWISRSGVCKITRAHGTETQSIFSLAKQTKYYLNCFSVIFTLLSSVCSLRGSQQAEERIVDDTSNNGQVSTATERYHSFDPTRGITSSQGSSSLSAMVMYKQQQQRCSAANHVYKWFTDLTFWCWMRFTLQFIWDKKQLWSASQFIATSAGKVAGQQTWDERRNGWASLCMLHRELPDAQCFLDEELGDLQFLEPSTMGSLYVLSMTHLAIRYSKDHLI